LVAAVLLVAQGINMFLLLRGVNQQNLVEASASAITRMAIGLNREFVREDRPRRGPRGGRNFRRARLDYADKPTVNESDNRLPELEDRAQLAFFNMGVEAVEVRAARYEKLPPSLVNHVIGLPRMKPRVDAIGRNIGERRRPAKIEGYIIVSSRLTDGRWVNLASAVRNHEPFLIRTLLFQTVFIYLLLLLPLILLGRHISRPLRLLTGQVETFGVGNREPLEANGPDDAKQLIAAFNKMQARVGSMLDEKDVMLGAIGHDLRTPLAALRVRIESVEDEAERDRMIAGIEDMDRTLDDILSLARLGRSQESSEQNDIQALIETVVDEFLDVGETVEFSRSSKISAPVRATLIRRALRNLIGNAVNYGKHAAVSVEKSEDKLTIIVDDDGPGLPEDQLDKMFEPFARAEKSRNRSTGGSGLGLTLARAIAREHGGEVTLSNCKEGGLRASLTLPLR